MATPSPSRTILDRLFGRNTTPVYAFPDAPEVPTLNPTLIQLWGLWGPDGPLSATHHEVRFVDDTENVVVPAEITQATCDLLIKTHAVTDALIPIPQLITVRAFVKDDELVLHASTRPKHVAEGEVVPEVPEHVEQDFVEVARANATMGIRFSVEEEDGEKFATWHVPLSSSS